MPKKIATTYQPDTLRTVIERLDRLTGRLKAISVWMEEVGCQELEITNHSSMIQGLEYAEAFGQAAERAADNFRLGEPKSRVVVEKE